MLLLCCCSIVTVLLLYSCCILAVSMLYCCCILAVFLLYCLYCCCIVTVSVVLQRASLLQCRFRFQKEGSESHRICLLLRLHIVPVLCVPSVVCVVYLVVLFRAPRYSELHVNKTEKHDNVEHHVLPLLYLCECGAQLNTSLEDVAICDCDPAFSASRSCYVVSAMLWRNGI